MTYVLLVLCVGQKHCLVQAPGPGVTVSFLTFLVLAQGEGGHKCAMRLPFAFEIHLLYTQAH